MADQQQALEADTVSRSEHEARQRQLAEALGMMHEPCQGPTWPADWDALLTTATEAKAKLTALQAELETEKAAVRCYMADLETERARAEEALADAKERWDRGTQRLVNLTDKLSAAECALATERARAEEAERRFKVAVDDCAFAVDGREALGTELAAANARAGRLEEALRAEQVDHNETQAQLAAANDDGRAVASLLESLAESGRAHPHHRTMEAMRRLLSTAPQASTERPDVGARAAEARQRIELEALDQATEQASQPPSEPRKHKLNEYTVCTVCKRFDPASPCPGPAQPAPGVTERCPLCLRNYKRLGYLSRDKWADGYDCPCAWHDKSDPTPAEPGGKERWDMPGAIGGANGHKAKQWASETCGAFVDQPLPLLRRVCVLPDGHDGAHQLEPADPTPAEPQVRPDGTNPTDEAIVDGLMAKRAQGLKVTPMGRPEQAVDDRLDRPVMIRELVVALRRCFLANVDPERIGWWLAEELEKARGR